MSRLFVQYLARGLPAVVGDDVEDFIPSSSASGSDMKFSDQRCIVLAMPKELAHGSAPRRGLSRFLHSRSINAAFPRCASASSFFSSTFLGSTFRRRRVSDASILPHQLLKQAFQHLHDIAWQ